MPNLQQVWQRYYDDPTWRISGSAILAAPTWQRHSDSTKASKELQVSRTKTKPSHVMREGLLLDYAACLELDLDSDTSGKVKTHQRINRSGVGVEDVDKTLVCTHLELIAGILILVR